MQRAFEYDLAIVGASFAGLAAAATAAARDLKVVVLEAKSRSGASIHTTGILVKEASEELDFPPALTRKNAWRAPLRTESETRRSIGTRLLFFATDTAPLLDRMAMRARELGADILTNSPFQNARVTNGKVALEPFGICARFVMGADGPISQVARVFALGRNRRFLRGVEAKFPFISGENDFLHCFLDSKFAPGYMGWMVPGVGVRQLGLALNQKCKPDLNGFIRKISSVTGEMVGPPTEIRGGLIPCGGTVAPFAGQHALLVGDAAGLVSPLTGGGIHRALYFGRRVALSVCDFLQDGGEHPGNAMAKHYPKFYWKRALRSAIDVKPPNFLYNALLSTNMFRRLAQRIFFHSRGGETVRNYQVRVQDLKETIRQSA